MSQQTNFLREVAGPVFLIGTGRSGTHWIAETLAAHPDVRSTIEVGPIFQWVTEMALNPATESRLFDPLIEAYRRELRVSAPRLYVDKSHPNLWLVEKLQAAFPAALFIGTQRNPYGTVASMLRHPEVLAWHQRWREFPVPNRFLGITAEVAEKYDEMPIAARCALRWLAHHERRNQLRETMGDLLLVVEYERLATDTPRVVRELQQFLGLKRELPQPPVKIESLGKWRTQLTAEAIRQIEEVTGISADEIR